MQSTQHRAWHTVSAQEMGLVAKDVQWEVIHSDWH